jgi:hypothetical protein
MITLKEKLPRFFAPYATLWQFVWQCGMLEVFSYTHLGLIDLLTGRNVSFTRIRYFEADLELLTEWALRGAR